MARLDPRTATPKTRKQLVWYLWNKGRTDCDLFKEGPFYASRVGNQLRATYVRAIDSLTYVEWETRHFTPHKPCH